MKTKRKIVVDGSTWSYLIGSANLLLRSGTLKHVIPLWRVCGLDPMTHERDAYKRASTTRISPVMVADVIRRPVWYQTAPIEQIAFGGAGQAGRPEYPGNGFQHRLYCDAYSGYTCSCR